MATPLSLVQHLKIVPPEPRWVEWNDSAAGRIGGKSRVLNRRQLYNSAHPYRGPRFGKKSFQRMDDVRKSAPQYDHEDRTIIKEVIDMLDNDVWPDTSGSAGAAKDITIQKEANVVGQRVKWGVVSSAAMLAAQIAGFL